MQSEFAQENESISIKKEQNLTVVRSSEHIIWENLISGDKSALGELYHMYIEQLLAYGLKCTKDRTYVMDCIHDLFVELFQYRKKLSTVNNVQSYLFKCLSRRINKKYKTKTYSVGEEYQFSLNPQLKNYTVSYEDEIILKEHLSEKSMFLERALKTLTKKQQKGIFLRYNLGKSYEEISDIMGISIQSARTTVYRAIKSLR